MMVAARSMFKGIQWLLPVVCLHLQTQTMLMAGMFSADFDLILKYLCSVAFKIILQIFVHFHPHILTLHAVHFLTQIFNSSCKCIKSLWLFPLCSRASSTLRWWLSAAERWSPCRWGGSAWWCWCSSNSSSRQQQPLLQQQEASVLLQTSQLPVAWTTPWGGQAWASRAPSSLAMVGTTVSLLSPVPCR